MAAAENAIALKNEMSMELPSLPPNQGFEAFKDILFGSVSRLAVSLSVELETTDAPSDCGNGREGNRIPF